jgi:hypothetical protein
LSSLLSSLQTKVDKQAANSAQTAGNTSASKSTDCIDCQSKCLDRSFGFWDVVLFASPIVLFIIILLISANRLKRDQKFSFSSMLSEKNASGEPLKDGDNNVNSASRYVLFLSGVVAAISAVTMVSYYLYFYLHTGCAPKFDNLLQPLLALGIGIVPYSVNKLTSK